MVRQVICRAPGTRDSDVAPGRSSINEKEGVMPNLKSMERRVRREAPRVGYYLSKSRQRKYVPNLDNCGELTVTPRTRALVTVFGFPTVEL